MKTALILTQDDQRIIKHLKEVESHMCVYCESCKTCDECIFNTSKGCIQSQLFTIAEDVKGM